MTIKDLKPGMRVTCNINCSVITDAKLQIEGGRFYICQNKRDGAVCKDKLGYFYSWALNSREVELVLNGSFVADVSNFKILKRDARYFDVGDVIKNGYSYREILAVLTRRDWKTVYLCSQYWVKDNPKEEILRSRQSTGGVSTAHELRGYKLVTYKKKTTKLTVSMDEVAKKFGVDVKKLKISKGK